MFIVLIDFIAAKIAKFLLSLNVNTKIFQNPQKLYMVMDYCPGGELFFHIQRVERFNEEAVKFYGAQLVLALDHLHKNNISYRA